MAVFIATVHLLAENAFAVVELRAASADAVCVRPDLVAHMAGTLVDDGGAA